MASESPYDRLGRPVANKPQQRRVPLYGGQFENAFTLAHRGVAEWRAWRQLCDTNEITDPLALSGTVVDGIGRLQSLDGAIDFTTDLGVAVTVAGGSATGSALELVVEDIAVGVFDLALRQIGASEAGTPIRLIEADWYDASGVPLSFRCILSTADAVNWIDLELTTDAWLIIWLAREIRLAFNGIPMRAEVRVPAPERVQ